MQHTPKWVFTCSFEAFFCFTLITIANLAPEAVAEAVVRHRRGFAAPPQKKTSLTKPVEHRAKISPGGEKKAKTAPPGRHLLLSGPMPLGAPCSTKLSLEKYLEVPRVWSIQRHSGKEKTFYFLADAGSETPQVFKGGELPSESSKLTDYVSGVTSFRSSPDGTKLLVSTDQNGDEAYGIHLVDTASKSHKPLIVDAKSRVQSMVWSPNNLWFAYTSNARNGVDFDLYRYDLKTSQSEKLADFAGMVEITDISPDSRFIALETFRSVTDSEVSIFDLQVKRQFAVPQRSSAELAARFSADSKNLLFLSDHSGFRGLYTIAFEPTPKKELRFGTQKRAGLNTKADFDICELSLKRDGLVCAINREGYSELIGWDIDRQGVPHRIRKMTSIGSAVVQDLAVEDSSPQPQVWISASASVTAPSIWTVSADKIQNRVQFGTPVPDPRCFPEERLIRIPSFDQKEFSAFDFAPAGARNQNLPYLLNIHGGPESQFRPSFNRSLLYLRSRGMGIFAPNIRGSLGYGRSFTLADNHRSRMDSVRDATTAARWLIDKNLTTPSRLGIFGGSYGGFVVLRAMQIEPALFAAASESVGITNLYTFLQNTKPYRRALREVEYGPLSDKDFLESVSPMKHLDKIRSPLLIFHGERDPRVPFSETQQLAEALRAKGRAVEIVSFKDEGHGVRKRSNAITQTRRLAYFFEKYLVERGFRAKDPK